MDQKEGKYVIHCIKHMSKRKSYKNVTAVYVCGVVFSVHSGSEYDNFMT